MRTIHILFAVIIFNSCTTIAKKSYGVKKQKPESAESIKEWLKKHNLPSDNTFSIAPNYFLEYTIGTQNAPLLFDKNSGRFLAIGFTNGKYCPKDLDKEFNRILPYNLLKEKPDSFLVGETISIPEGYSIKDKDKFKHSYDTSFIRLSNLYQWARSLTGKQVENISKSDADYILIIPFAIYLGEKTQLKEINKYYYSAISNRFSKFDIIFMNLDKQLWWTDKWNNTNTLKYN